MRSLMRRPMHAPIALLAVALFAQLDAMTIVAQAPATRAARAVPTPASVIGFEPGTDRKIPSWKQVTDYFSALDAASPRVQVRTLGKTTMGRPFIAAFIGDEATLADLPKYREIQRKLADPRVRVAGEKERLLADGKTVVLVTSSIHSTEVGGIMTPLVLAHRLASAEDEETRAIRASSIVILVPSLNPDGVDIVGDWYRATLGTKAEGSGPPELYHKYVGHDNNRDWYAFTQVETQMTVDSLHNVWHPQVVNDIHQQGGNGSRIFIPPYMDPIEPNVDPILVAGVNQMGMSMIWRMTAEGKPGLAYNTSYDLWTPARAYMHYHGGIRILTETASASLATPVDVPFESLRPGYNVDPKEASTNFLIPWRGGRWTIKDIVDYQTTATWALLTQSAIDRRKWLESFATVSERAVAGRAVPGREEWPAAFVIPAAQRDTGALATLLRILQRGGVEIRRATGPVVYENLNVADSRQTYPAGSYVVSTAQPYGAFAKALLERQKYPDLHEYPGGPPKRPYDVTAHTLPLLLGLHVVPIRDSVPASAPVAPIPAPRLVAPGLSDRTARRIAIYRNYSPSMDEGWTRWIFEQYRIPFTSVVDRDMRAGNLNARFDVILLPDQAPAQLTRGAPATYPDSLRGGLGDAGAAALKAFVEAGGTLVTFNEASNYAIGALGLPVKDALQGIPPKDFYAPGSIFAVAANRDHPIGAALAQPPAIWFEEGPAFEITDPARATAIASYRAEGDPLLSGWLLGAPKLAGKAALVEVKQGKGRVVLFGFRPQYRAQSMATYPAIWAALR
ncbi:MAG: M14 family metallopeptidase [Gemmatimonadaceae bacterium]